MAAQPLPITAPRPHTIRPWRLFTTLTTPPNDRIAHVPIPARRGYGGISLLETFLLVASCRLVRARRLFEFGTFLGSTTYSLALNTTPDARIFTLDFDPATSPSIRQHDADAPLTALHKQARALDFTATPIEHKITQLTGDSLRFDFSPWRGQMDWIFIDGGHDLVSVRSDTENAFDLIDRRQLCCILWHDYQNPDADYSDLTRYLNALSADRQIFHIGDTMLCLWINDPDNQVLPKLLG